MHPALYKALRCQILAIAAVFILGQSGFLPPIDSLALAALQSICASFIALLTKSDRWWISLHLVFLPGVVLASQLNISANVYGVFFLVTFFVYWTTFRTRVPLFLSNRASIHRLATKLPDSKTLQILDIGSGTGTFVHILAKLRPEWHVSGCELAPVPFLISRWRTRAMLNTKLIRQDFWGHPFCNYDVIYAFLSPAPMEDLWRKARKEMRPDSLFVSNSFPIATLTPSFTIAVGDRRQTQLFCYRIPTKGRQQEFVGSTLEATSP